MRARALRRATRAGALVAVTVLLGLVLAPLVPGPAPVGPARAMGVATGAVTGSITGPSTLGPAARGTYTVVASGGPAQASNGTIVGTYSFTASIVGANTTGGTVNPPQGVLVNGTTTVTLLTPNATEPLTLYVDVTSSYQGQNSSTNLTYQVDVLRPIILAGGLKVVGPTGVRPFALTVLLDGEVVGSVAVPSLTAGQSYPFSFSYLGTGLAPGWHTFSVSLAQEHGLVTFTNGQESYTSSFYVAGPSPNLGPWILAGLSAFVAVVFIWATRLGARRRPKAKS